MVDFAAWVVESASLEQATLSALAGWLPAGRVGVAVSALAREGAGRVGGDDKEGIAVGSRVR
jgi:hypothetical protein